MDATSPSSRRNFAVITLLAAAVLGVLYLGYEISVSRDGAGARRPHLVLITADTLRKDHLGAYGAPGGRTPVLDRLARSSFLFPDFVSASNNTSVAFASLHTGTYMRTHKVQGLFYPLDGSFRTLAEVLGEAGYLTVAAVSAPVVDGTISNLRQGFDRYADCGDEYAKQPAAVTNEKLLAALDEESRAEARDVPLFLWVHYFDPHWPYKPESPFDALFGGERAGAEPPVPHSSKGVRFDEEAERRYRNRYAAEIRSMDARIGELLAALDERDVLDESIVVFVADHGENLGERGLFANHQRLYRPVSEPPLWIRLPGDAGGRLVREPAQTVDLLPTLAELARAPIPEGVEGRSLAPLLRPGAGGSTASEPRDLFSEGAYQKEKFLRRGRYKLTYRLQPQYAEGESYELYDVWDDPAERRDLVRAEPERADALREELASFLGEVPMRVRVTSADGGAHAVRVGLRPLKTRVASFDGVGLEEEDSLTATPGGGVAAELRVGSDDADEVVVIAAGAAIFGVAAEVDGRPARLAELRLGDRRATETAVRSILFLEEDALSGGALPGGAPGLRVEAVPAGEGTSLRASWSLGEKPGPRSGLEIRLFAAGESIRSIAAHPPASATWTVQGDRCRVRTADREGTLAIELQRGTTHLLADPRLGGRPLDPERFVRGRGIGGAAGLAPPALLYSPRFRFDEREGEGDAEPTGEPRVEHPPGAVRIELSSPFLGSPGAGAGLGGLSPEMLEHLRRLGYVGDDNPQN